MACLLVHAQSARSRAGELGDGFGAFRHGVLGQLARQDQAHGRLDLAAGHRGLLVVARQLRGLGGNLLEDVVDEGVQDRHGLGADAGVRVHLQRVNENGVSARGRSTARQAYTRTGAKAQP